LDKDSTYNGGEFDVEECQMQQPYKCQLQEKVMAMRIKE
jgi:hypothetical protein